MRRLWKEIGKHVNILMIFIKNCLAGQLEYRANFITGMMMELGYLFAKMLYVIVIYKSGSAINGLTPDEILVFIGTYVLVTGFFAGFYMINLYSFSELIRNGTLDFYITKPISLQFMLTLRRSDISLFIIDLVAGTALITTGLIRLGRPVNLLVLCGFLGYVLAGNIVGYSLFLIPQLLAFKIVNTHALSGIMDSLWDFNNMPMGIYPKAIQRLGVFVIPIFAVTNLPAMFILGRMDTTYAVWGIVSPILFLVLARLLWKTAVRNYSSASS